MNRKAIARETLEIMEKGYYVISGKRGSFPKACAKHGINPGFTRVENISTVDAIPHPARSCETG